jgi:hypothetical protein
VCWNRGVPRPLGALRHLSRKSSRIRRVDRAGTRLAAGDDPGEQRDTVRACTATTWDLPGCTRHSGRRRSRQRAGRYRRPVHWPLSWSGWAVRIRSGPSGCAATDRAAASTGSGTGDDSSSSGGSAASVCVMALTYDEASELAVLSASGSPRRPPQQSADHAGRVVSGVFGAMTPSTAGAVGRNVGSVAMAEWSSVRRGRTVRRRSRCIGRCGLARWSRRW